MGASALGFCGAGWLLPPAGGVAVGAGALCVGADPEEGAFGGGWPQPAIESPSATLAITNVLCSRCKIREPKIDIQQPPPHEPGRRGRVSSQSREQGPAPQQLQIAAHT